MAFSERLDELGDKIPAKYATLKNDDSSEVDSDIFRSLNSLTLEAISTKTRPPLIICLCFGHLISRWGLSALLAFELLSVGNADDLLTSWLP